MGNQALISAIAISALCGCRLLETGYGDDNAVVRTSQDAASATSKAARSTVAWAGAKVRSFGDDLEPELQNRFIVLGEHSAAAYRGGPALPEGFIPLSADEFARLGISGSRYRFEPGTGFLEDVEGVGFGARISRSLANGELVVAFRGSNSPGEDEHWVQDWMVDAQQGGGGTPRQYIYGAEVLAGVRQAFPSAKITVTGHSLGGGIAAYATMRLEEPGRLLCATFNAAGISSMTLLALPSDVVAQAKSRITNIRSKGDPVSAIPGTQLVGEIYEVDNLRFANHAMGGLLIDMRRRAENRKAGWLRDLFDD